MRTIYKGGVTPQQKLVAVNDKFGNKSVKSQQGTTRQLYDTLSHSGNAETLRFFEDSASRNFPLTNTGSDGNKLGVGDTMVVSAIQFSVKNGNTLEYISNLFTSGQISFEIANNRVIKDLALTEAKTYVNETTSNNLNSFILFLETEIVIPPLLNYVLELRTPNLGGNDSIVRCDIIGAAGIIAPRTTF